MAVEVSSLDNPDRTPENKGVRRGTAIVSKAEVYEEPWYKKAFRKNREDDVKEVVKDKFLEWMIPRVRDGLADLGNAVADGIGEFMRSMVETAIYGDDVPRYSNKSGRPMNTSYTNYNKKSSSTNNYYNRQHGLHDEGERRRTARYEPVIVMEYYIDEHGRRKRNPDARLKAQAIYDKVVAETYQYGMTTVGYLYDLAEREVWHTDFRWGWYDLSNSGVRKVKDGWLIDLPKPVEIDDE